MVSSTFLRDVQSSQWITTTSSAQCGSGNQLLGLAWNGTNAATETASNNQTVVSYVSTAVTVGTTTTYSLVRQYCTFGSSTPVSTVTLSYDLAGPQVAPLVSTQLPPCLTGISCVPSSSTTAWTAASGVPAVKFVISELKSPYTYTLIATPRAWTAASGGGPPGGQYPFAPLTLMGGGCNDLTLKNNGTLSINVGGGTGNGQIAVDSTCPGAVSVSNGATLGASSIVTADPTLDSATGGGSFPSTEYYTSTFSDPFAPPSTNALVTPTPSGSTVTCTLVGNLYTCPPGNYPVDPGFKNGSTIVFTGERHLQLHQRLHHSERRHRHLRHGDLHLRWQLLDGT